MLHHCYPEIAKREPSEDRNVYIECFALHARALYEFLVSHSPRGLNAVAHDFIADFEPSDTDNSVRDVIKKIEDQILHIGWERTEHHRLKFDADAEGARILNWIDGWFIYFWARLPGEYLDPP